MQAFQVKDRVYHLRGNGPWGEPAAGPTVVFSNSLGTDLRVWDPLLHHLPENWRTLRYDTVGHGLTAFTGPMIIAEHAEDVAAILDAYGLKQTVFVGLSVGGLIAQALIKSRPDTVGALALCDTASKIGNDEIWNGRISAVESGGLVSISEAILERWFSNTFITDRADELALWRTMLLRTPDEAYCALSAAIRDADFSADAPNIEVPTLCVVGSEDGATTPDVVRATADSIPGARFEEIAGAGHLPCVEAPETLAKLLIQFVEESGL